MLDQLKQHVQKEAVDALIIAGDIYDRAVPPAAAVELLDAFVSEVCTDMGVPIVMISGNHDGAERLRFGARQLQAAGLHILADLTQVDVPVEIEGVAFYGIPYHDPETIRSLFDESVKDYDAAHSFLVEKINASRDLDRPSVLISHCFIDGAEESESERPLSIGGADRVGYQPLLEFDYVALGHLHSPQFRGKEYIRYSGSLLKYSFSECHQTKGVNLVEFNSEGLMSTRQLPLKALRDMRIVEGTMEDILAQGQVDPGREDYLLVRLTDRHAILDPMGKLRAVYPNVLHLEKPGMLDTGERRTDKAMLKRGELDMFRDFFVQIKGEALTEEQDSAITDVINELKQRETNK